MVAIEEILRQAIVRDLARLCRMLQPRSVVPREQRRALAHHVVWLAGFLMESQDHSVSLKRTAREFYHKPTRPVQLELLAAVRDAGVAFQAGELVLDPRRTAELGAHVEWLCDGMPRQHADQIARALAPQDSPGRRQQLAQVYAFRMRQVWGQALARV